MALAVHTPGNMAQTNWKASVYLDDRATAGQREALAAIFGDQAGGNPAALARRVAEVAGVAAVPLTFETDGKKGRLAIGEVGSVEAEALQGQGGAAPTIENHPLAVAPGYKAVVGRSKRAVFNQHGIRLDARGKSALLAPFSYAG